MNMSSLNPMLIERQNLTDTELAEILRLHTVRENVFETMESLIPTEDANLLVACVDLVAKLEFALQRAWRFEVDDSMHTWWFMSPHCSCSKTENWKVFLNDGQGGRHINEECILHSNC